MDSDELPQARQSVRRLGHACNDTITHHTAGFQLMCCGLCDILVCTRTYREASATSHRSSDERKARSKSLRLQRPRTPTGSATTGMKTEMDGGTQSQGRAPCRLHSESSSSGDVLRRIRSSSRSSKHARQSYMLGESGKRNRKGCVVSMASWTHSTMRVAM